MESRQDKQVDLGPSDHKGYDKLHFPEREPPGAEAAGLYRVSARG
jgi:hypothetical protein